jgi:6-phospho-beta-glucosidase
MDNGLRVSILGGGSAYTPGLIEAFIRLKGRIPVDRFILMDIDGRKLHTVGNLVKKMAETALPAADITLTEDRSEAIRNADFVLCQIRVGGLAARHLDESIPISMGIIGQETVGAGGFAMALRTIPVMVEIAQEIQQVNPSAWLINYTNPTGMVAEAISRTSTAKHVAICDEPMILQQSLAAMVGAPPERIFMDYFGLNHLGFARKVYYRGSDILPVLRQRLQEIPREQVDAIYGEQILRDPKTRTEITNTLRIFEETGMLPSPYLQYYYFTQEIIRHQQESGRTRAQEVMEIEKGLLKEYEQVARGRKSLESRRGGQWHADMMVGMLAAIANDTREVYIVNVPNHGALPELPYEKIVEVPATVDASGAHPLAMGTMPLKVRGLIQSVAAYEELAVDAALSGSRRLAIDALACHPLVGSRDLARKLLEAYLDAHEQYLPQFRGS